MAGSARGVEVIEEGLSAKSWAGEVVVREMVDEIFAIFARRGFQPADDHKTGPPCYHHQIIIAGLGEVFDIGEDGSISTPAWGFVACGSGAPWAEGAAWALVQQKQHSAEDIVALSLRAALQFRSDCGGDLVIERVG